MRRLLQKLFHKSGKKSQSSATKNTNLQKPIKEVTFAEQVFSIKTGDTNNHINDTLPKDGVYEPWVSKYVVLASKFYGEDKDAIDIGANVGIIALGLAGLQKKASIIAFEPLSFAYSQLCKNIVRNKYSNITAEQMIVADEDTQESYIHVPIREAMSSSFISAQRHMEDSRHTEKIPSIRLDTYLSYKTNTFDIKIIKIDVESAERSVLTGAENTIHKYQPVVFLEFNVQNRSLEFERKGYLLYQKVASLFQFIYLIDRVSQQLFRITNYSELRGMMLAGHFVEDLLCFNDDSFAHFLKEYIKDASYRSYHAANANLHKISQGLQVFLSHYPDNWCNEHDFFFFSQSIKPLSFTLYLENNGAHKVNHLLLVNQNQLEEIMLVRDRVVRKEFTAKANEIVFIYIFVEKTFAAKEFFQNNDPRQLGIIIKIENS